MCSGLQAFYAGPFLPARFAALDDGLTPHDTVPSFRDCLNAWSCPATVASYSVAVGAGRM